MSTGMFGFNDVQQTRLPTWQFQVHVSMLAYSINNQ